MKIPLLEVVTATILPAVTVLFFGPLEIFLGNPAEFSVPVFGTLLAQLIIALAGVAVLVGIIFALPLPLKSLAVSLTLGLGFAAYLQGNIFLWNYGLLDGTEIQWSIHRIHGFLELLAWLTILFVCIKWQGLIAHHAALMALFLIAIQAVALGIQSTQYTSLPHHLYNVDGSTLMDFSPEENGILIVVDSFQSSTFKDIIQDDDAFPEVARGFTYFENAVAGYSKTLGSVPNLLTGAYNLNESTVPEYLESAFASSVFSDAKRAGLRVEAYPLNDKSIHFDPKVIDNLAANFGFATYIRESARFVDLSLFRHAPHFLKPLIFRDQRWLFSAAGDPASDSKKNKTRLPQDVGVRDRVFYQRIESMRISDAPPAARLKYIHLQGPHEPFLLDENVELKRLPFGPEAFKTQARAAMTILQRLLLHLQTLGIYDSSVIMIVADHGGGEYSIPYKLEGGARKAVATVDQRVVSGGIPLVLVKPKDATGRMDISKAPVELADVPATMASLLGISTKSDRRSMTKIAESEIRDRRHYYYDFKGWDRDYLPQLTEYKITGFSWDPASWKATGRVFEPGTELGDTLEEEAPPYNGEPFPLLPEGKWISTRIDGAGTRYLPHGWSPPGPDRVWSAGKSAYIAFTLPGGDADMRLMMSLSPLVFPPKLPVQTVRLTANDQSLGEWQASELGIYSTPSFEPSPTARKITLFLEIPHAASPLLDLGAPINDSRTLGVAIHRIRLQRLETLPADGLSIRFGTGGNSDGFLDAGWSEDEAEGTWSRGSESSLIFKAPRGSENAGNWELAADLTPISYPETLEENRVDVFLDGDPIATWLANGERAFATVFAMLQEGPHTLTFRVAHPAVPAEHDPKNTDRRLLGAFFRELDIKPAKLD